ncbi:MAG: ABC transporter substrate-binding protein [Caldilineaceae bacterium]
MNKPNRIHPAVLDAASDMRKGKVSRREFLWLATMLGTSATMAYAMAGCAPPAGAPTGDSAAAPAAAPAGGVKRGGSWTSAMQLQLIDHPARLSWVQGANIVRQVGEYLTETGSDNITRPYLLDKWEANDDVTEWTLYLRKDVTFNNGDKLTADDVMFTFGEWLNPDVGSSILGLMSYLDGINSVEKVDDYTIKLHLNSGNIGIPEHLFHYPAIILHRSFEGDFIKSPIGTGAFTLKEYKEGERAVFEARKDYWRKAADGSSLPYLDTLNYVSLDHDAGVAALLSGQVDSLYNPTASDWEALKDNADLAVYAASTAQVSLGRVRVDLDPWTDIRVVNALKMVQDRQKILDLVYKGQGDLAIDAHVAPAHPEYAKRDIPKYDPEGAKKLLDEYAKEKGVELPLKVKLATKNDEGEDKIAQALKELAAPGGFDIELDITDANGYWDRWTEVDLGITAWTHRPLGTMVLPLAYIADADGKPVPWNETRWVDEEFTTILRQAEKTLDVEKRRELMGQLEDIMQQRGPVFISYWKKVWNITRKEFQGVQAHPTSYDLLYEVWKNA